MIPLTGAVRAFWYNAANVGDLLTPFILEKLTGRPVELSTTSPKWLVSGSVLDRALPGDILCGVGSFRKPVTITGTQVRTLLVRGPYTAEQLTVRSERVLCGDAGLLLPGVYAPSAPQLTHDVGIVAHYVDEAYAATISLPKGVRLIAVSLPVKAFIAAVRSCARILASSLHGLVVAEAYGVPAVRTVFPNTRDQVLDYDYKHADYYLGTGRPVPEAVDLATALTRMPGICHAVQDRARTVSAHVRRELIEGGFEYG